MYLKSRVFSKMSTFKLHIPHRQGNMDPKKLFTLYIANVLKSFYKISSHSVQINILNMKDCKIQNNLTKG